MFRYIPFIQLLVLRNDYNCRSNRAVLWPCHQRRSLNEPQQKCCQSYNYRSQTRQSTGEIREGNQSYTELYTYIHAYMHTYMHTYIYVCIYIYHASCTSFVLRVMKEGTRSWWGRNIDSFCELRTKVEGKYVFLWVLFAETAALSNTVSHKRLLIEGTLYFSLFKYSYISSVQVHHVSF